MQEYKKLLAELEQADTGSAELDAKIAYVVYPDRRLIMLSGEPHWITWENGRRIDVPTPRFTRSIDAGLAWEEIVQVEKVAQQQPFWRARQHPIYQADAATEILARRCAALKNKILLDQPAPTWSAIAFDQATGERTSTRFLDNPGFEIPNLDNRGRYRMRPETPSATKDELITILVDHIRYLNRNVPGGSQPLHDLNPAPANQGYYEPPQVPLASMASEVTSRILLSRIFEMWLDEKKPGLKNRQRMETSVRRFIEFLGDKPVTDYTKSDTRAFFNALWDLPKFTPNDMKRLPMPVILEHFAGKPIQRITVNTVKGHQKDLNSVFNWAHHFEYCGSNPIIDFKFKDRRLQSEKRIPFTESDLKLIFEKSPVYAGCASPMKRKVPGDQIIRDSLFWLGLMGLFTGARLSEIGRSEVGDYMFEEGIYYLDIHTRRDGPHLKTTSADRQIPLHPELIRIGFLDWVQGRRDKGVSTVFGEMAGRRDVDGAKGSWSQCWMTYQRAIGITDHRKVFHSFRHCFKRACREAGIEEEIHDAITGHRPYFSGRRYGGPMPLKITHRALSKVSYNLNLERLYTQ